jgi:hypothetical protein
MIASELPKTSKFYSVDNDPTIAWKWMCCEYPQLTKILGDDLDMGIWNGVKLKETELWFIDTLHVASQLKKELARHADKAKINSIVKQVHDEVTKAAGRHPGIVVIPMIDLFNEDGELFNKRYSRDGVHFNELGRQKFFDLITQAIKG